MDTCRVNPAPEHKRQGMEKLEQFNTERVFACAVLVDDFPVLLNC